MIQVKNLSKSFDDIHAVDDISFSINSGEITGFLGPNGAGKSTTLKMLSAFLLPTSGEILFDGISLKDYEYDIRKEIGYLPELNPLYHDLLVYDYLKYIAVLKEVETKQIKEKILYIAKKCGITERLSQMIGTLSKGYKQRVGLASVLINDPKILILDEPTVGLDPNQIIEIRNLISELGKDKTVILSSHILHEIQAICNRILIIHKGKIIADTTKDDILTKIKQKNVVNMTLNKPLSPEIIQKIHENLVISNHSNNQYTLEYPVELDLREDIFDCIVSNDLKILEITQQAGKLEDVFAILTNQ